MSEAVKSDGVVNKQVLDMCKRGLSRYTHNGGRKAVDEILKDDDLLKQCEYETLVLAAYEYATTFGDKNWCIHDHIVIKAQQSNKYRDFKAGRTGRVATDATDPLELLRLRKRRKS